MSGYRVTGGWDRPARWTTEVKPDPAGSRAQRREAKRRGLTCPCCAGPRHGMVQPEALGNTTGLG
jgi:hypothetical protein